LLLKEEEAAAAEEKDVLKRTLRQPEYGEPFPNFFVIQTMQADCAKWLSKTLLQK